MRANWLLFAYLAGFYILMTVIYWYLGGEPVGITGMTLSAGLSGMIAFYLWFTQKRIGTDLPSDRDDAEIADDAGELGFYSPHSWWPLPVALSATAMSLGLIIGWWLTLIALGALVLSIVGMFTEYEKPVKSHS